MGEAISNYAFDDSLIRVVLRGGEPWFVAKDVCAVLEVQNASQAVEPLDEDEVAGVCLTYTSSNGVEQDRETLVVSESGLYTLILRSRQAVTPGTPAHRFRRWVTGELLPMIRKTGRYDDGGFDWQEIGEKLKLVREARLAHGRKAAQVLWSELGLPLPLPEAAPARPAGSDGIDFVREFLAERTAEAPGGRVTATALFEAYRNWATETGRPTMTGTAFGLTLNRIGLSKSRGHLVHYFGIRLLHFNEFAEGVARDEPPAP